MAEKNLNDARGRESLRERLRRRYGAHALFGERERITLEGGRRAVVYGCMAIVVYSPCEIRLRLSHEELSVVGERLYCSSFSAGTVTVEGNVGGVLYRSYQKMREKEGKTGK